MWQHGVNTVLGLWVLAVPFLGFTGTTLTWALALTGLAIAVLGIWGAQRESSAREHMGEREYRLQHRHS